MKFIVEQQVFAALPEACFGVVIAKGIDNTKPYPAIASMLEEGVRAAERRYAEQPVKEDLLVLPYRQAFAQLSINPNKFMSSIEAMLTRVSKGKGLPSINPIVDIGNALSLKYALPMGAHDIAKLGGADIEVRFSREGDTFLPFGETTPETMPAGELVYAAGSAIRTRRWIWRQSELGKIDESSRDIFFPIDGFANANKEAVMTARDELAAFCREVFGCAEVACGFVSRENGEMGI